MNTITTQYTSADIPALMNRIARNTIGMDEHFDRIFKVTDGYSNYPPYNRIVLSDTEQCIEMALAGFKKNDVSVYTKDGKLIVEGRKENKENKENKLTYLHRGLAQRSFTISWPLADDTEVKDVNFEDGLLTIKLAKVVPEHHLRKDYL